MKRIILTAAAFAAMIATQADAGVLRAVRFALRHPKKTAHLVSFPVRHPVRTVR